MCMAAHVVVDQSINVMTSTRFNRIKSLAGVVVVVVVTTFITRPRVHGMTQSNRQQNALPFINSRFRVSILIPTEIASDSK